MTNEINRLITALKEIYDTVDLFCPSQQQANNVAKIREIVASVIQLPEMQSPPTEPKE